MSNLSVGTVEFDIITGPGLACRIAQEAERCRHSFLKNGFMLLGDRPLSAWLKDNGAMQEFEECVKVVCTAIDGFSGAVLLGQVRPLADLSGTQRDALQKMLAIAFADGFRPEEVCFQLQAKADRLLGLVRQFRDVTGQELADRLGAIRSAAGALREEMETLPRGFWVPRLRQCRRLAGLEIG